MIGFEWDDDKAARNLRSHGVSFEMAALVFRDPFAVEWIDMREAYGEERLILLAWLSVACCWSVYNGARGQHSDHYGPLGNET